MTYFLSWLDVNVETLNVTFKLLVIYRYRFSTFNQSYSKSILQQQ